jgi:hypothetical protein
VAYKVNNTNMKLFGEKKLKKKHIKKAAIVALYSVVVIVMIAGMISPALMS